MKNGIYSFKHSLFYCKIRNIFKGKKRNDNYLYSFIICLSALSFILIYGIKVINPTYTDWLLASGDLTQHYIGWMAYRNGDWTFPIGLTNQLAYPSYTSVMFTDSIPLFAVFFKILSPILPRHFQYFGLWGILCFILQGCFATRIFKNFLNNKLAIIAASLLIVYSPVMLFRMFIHTSLAGQWLLLFFLYPLFAYGKYTSNKKIYFTTALVGFLSAAIHMYFAAMCGIILLGICIRDLFENKRFKRTVLLLLDYLAALLLTTWILGGFASKGISYSIGEDLGTYSMNLNSLYNPFGWSRFFKDKVLFAVGQGEGFGYLGAGGFLLSAVTLIKFISNEKFIEFVKENWKKCAPIIIVSIITFFVAASPTISYNNLELIRFVFPEIVIKLWGIFRACGRIVMLLVYLLLVSFIVFDGKTSPRKFLGVLMAMCLAIQILDISGVLIGKNNKFGERVSYQSPLGQQEAWNAIASDKEIKHIVITYWMEADFYEVGNFAMENEKTLNVFAMVHPNVEQLLNDVNELLRNPTEDEVFVFDRYDPLWMGYNNLHFYSAGNNVIGSLKSLKGLTQIEQLKIKLSADFSDNQYLRDGTDSNGVRIINPGGVSYGPYWQIPVGSYKIVIRGQKLQDRISISVCSKGGTLNHDYKILESNDDEIALTFLTEDNIGDLEIVIVNISSEDIVLNDIEIERILQ